MSRAQAGVLSVRVTSFLIIVMVNAVCVMSGCTCVRCERGPKSSRFLGDQHRSALRDVQAKSGIPECTWVCCQYGLSPAWSLFPFCWASRVYMGTLLVRDASSLQFACIHAESLNRGLVCACQVRGRFRPVTCFAGVLQPRWSLLSSSC